MSSSMSDRGIVRAPHRLPAPDPIEPGTAGRPPEGEVERRGSEASETIRAQVRAAMRERRLGTRLERSIDGIGFVLHHRVVDHSSTPVDHIVIGVTGVWVVRAVHAVGKVSVDEAAGAIKVGDQHVALVVPIDAPDSPTVAALERALEAIGYDWVPVRRVVCLTRSPQHRDRQVNGAVVTSPRRLVSAILGRGQLAPADVRTIAAALNTRFAPASGHDAR